MTMSGRVSGVDSGSTRGFFDFSLESCVRSTRDVLVPGGGVALIHRRTPSMSLTLVSKQIKTRNGGSHTWDVAQSGYDEEGTDSC